MTMTREEIEALIKLLDNAYEWVREPDYAEKFSLDDLTKWVNARPASVIYRASAALKQSEADLAAAIAQARREALEEAAKICDDEDQSISYSGAHNNMIARQNALEEAATKIRRMAEES